MEISSILKSEEIYDLVELILNEQFSKEVSDIGKDLLYNGVSSIPEIQSRLRLSFDNVKNVLIILMQNKLCSSTELIKKDTKVIGYEIIIENVLNILLFPKILYIGKNKFGEYGTMIFEEFMQFGILSSIQVFEQVKNKIEKTRKFNNAMMNKIKVTFINLIESNYIVQAQKVTNALKERTREIVNRNLTKPKRNNKSKDNTIRKSTLPLSQIYRNASPYSDLFTWNNLFSYRHIQHNISQEHCNNFSPKSNNTTAHRKTKEHQEQMLNDEKVPHNIRKQSQCSEYLIKKKNEMLEGILSKKNIDYSKMNMQNYSSYSVLPFKKKLSYLIEKKCKE